MKKLLYFLIGLITGTILGIFLIISPYFQSPSINESRRAFTHEDIYQDPSHTTTALISMNNVFNIALVENARLVACNPNFPAIHISTKAQHNTWFQVIRTDCSQCQYQTFIDTAPHVTPFYYQPVPNIDFYDTPQWGYSLFFKPITFWRAHAYAIQVDHESKTIQCLGGIFWGYSLSYFHLKPCAYKPAALSLQDFMQDWQLLAKELPEYRCINMQNT